MTIKMLAENKGENIVLSATLMSKEPLPWSLSALAEEAKRIAYEYGSLYKYTTFTTIESKPGSKVNKIKEWL